MDLAGRQSIRARHSRCGLAAALAATLCGWRALAAALGSAGAARRAALRDTLAFRAARHAAFPGAAENERLMEINEGLAQYTGTAVAAPSHQAAVADAIDQLAKAPENATFVRTFPYPAGAAYGLLLDTVAPAWTRRVKSGDDLAAMTMAAAGVEPTADARGAAARYGGGELRASEEARDAERQVRMTGLSG